MGYLINPIGFRVGQTTGWVDSWFSYKKVYPEFLHFILKIRLFLNAYLDSFPTEDDLAYLVSFHEDSFVGDDENDKDNVLKKKKKNMLLNHNDSLFLSSVMYSHFRIVFNLTSVYISLFVYPGKYWDLLFDYKKTKTRSSFLFDNFFFRKRFKSFSKKTKFFLKKKKRVRRFRHFNFSFRFFRKSLQGYPLYRIFNKKDLNFFLLNKKQTRLKISLVKLRSFILPFWKTFLFFNFKKVLKSFKSYSICLRYLLKIRYRIKVLLNYNIVKAGGIVLQKLKKRLYFLRSCLFKMRRLCFFYRLKILKKKVSRKMFIWRYWRRILPFSFFLKFFRSVRKHIFNLNRFGLPIFFFRKFILKNRKNILKKYDLQKYSSKKLKVIRFSKRFLCGLFLKKKRKKKFKFRKIKGLKKFFWSYQRGFHFLLLFFFFFKPFAILRNFKRVFFKSYKRRFFFLKNFSLTFLEKKPFYLNFYVKKNFNVFSVVSANFFFFNGFFLFYKYWGFFKLKNKFFIKFFKNRYLFKKKRFFFKVPFRLRVFSNFFSFNFYKMFFFKLNFLFGKKSFYFSKLKKNVFFVSSYLYFFFKVFRFFRNFFFFKNFSNYFSVRSKFLVLNLCFFNNLGFFKIRKFFQKKNLGFKRLLNSSNVNKLRTVLKINKNFFLQKFVQKPLISSFNNMLGYSIKKDKRVFNKNSFTFINQIVSYKFTNLFQKSSVFFYKGFLNYFFFKKKNYLRKKTSFGFSSFFSSLLHKKLFFLSKKNVYLFGTNKINNLNKLFIFYPFFIIDRFFVFDFFVKSSMFFHKSKVFFFFKRPFALKKSRLFFFFSFLRKRRNFYFLVYKKFNLYSKYLSKFRPKIFYDFSKKMTIGSSNFFISFFYIFLTWVFRKLPKKNSWRILRKKLRIPRKDMGNWKNFEWERRDRIKRLVHKRRRFRSFRFRRKMRRLKRGKSFKLNKRMRKFTSKFMKRFFYINWDFLVSFIIDNFFFKYNVDVKYFLIFILFFKDFNFTQRFFSGSKSSVETWDFLKRQFIFKFLSIHFESLQYSSFDFCLQPFLLKMIPFEDIKVFSYLIDILL